MMSQTTVYSQQQQEQYTTTQSTTSSSYELIELDTCTYNIGLTTNEKQELYKLVDNILYNNTNNNTQQVCISIVMFVYIFVLYIIY